MANTHELYNQMRDRNAQYGAVMDHVITLRGILSRAEASLDEAEQAYLAARWEWQQAIGEVPGTLTQPAPVQEVSP